VLKQQHFASRPTTPLHLFERHCRILERAQPERVHLTQRKPRVRNKKHKVMEGTLVRRPCS